MTINNWRRSVNQTTGTHTSTLLSTCINSKVKPYPAPIDVFYTETKDIISKFAPQDFLTCDWLGSYLSLGIFSSTENYFREIFSEIISICPCAQKTSASSPINLGSVIWHPVGDIARGAFEHLSFADSDMIFKSARNYIGIELKIPQFVKIFEEFDKICELRHGIVHSSRIIAGKNAIKLGLNSSKDKSYITIGYSELQDIMAACNNLVTTINTFLFEKISHRWAIDWRTFPSWSITDEHINFKKIWTIFYSSIDSGHGTIPSKLTLMKCKNMIKSEYGLA
ncbi:hypothetical protein [Enterobacter bugandensis]|uniref:hypothetical protein n=1 Tax=Enterobacter bugandensis TaxID=881260 RepID=UPI0037541B50